MSVNFCINFYLLFPGVYHHYDTIAYPHNLKSKHAKESVAEKISAAFKGFLPWWLSSKHSEENKVKEFVPQTFQEMCEICLHIYLVDYSNMLSKCSFPHQFNITTVVEKIGIVYTSLRCPLTIEDGSESPTEKIQRHIPHVHCVRLL